MLTQRNGRAAALTVTLLKARYIMQWSSSRGWGTKLYQALFSELREKSIHLVIGGIALPNPASIALHEKMGMEKVAHFSEVGFEFGRWIDVGYWQMPLLRVKAFKWLKHGSLG